uniref:Uncharacterized protein n=1 Tax=Anguilla anguilla TaxID=7936 RepID=A0A0E9WC81_ANGAN
MPSMKEHSCEQDRNSNYQDRKYLGPPPKKTMSTKIMNAQFSTTILFYSNAHTGEYLPYGRRGTSNPNKFTYEKLHIGTLKILKQS